MERAWQRKLRARLVTLQCRRSLHTDGLRLLCIPTSCCGAVLSMGFPPATKRAWPEKGAEKGASHFSQRCQPLFKGGKVPATFRKGASHFSQRCQPLFTKVPATLHKGASHFSKGANHFSQRCQPLFAKVPATFRKGAAKVPTTFHKGASHSSQRCQPLLNEVPFLFPKEPPHVHSDNSPQHRWPSQTTA
jgi:hypothetical protein